MIGPGHIGIVILLLIVLVIFGPKRLPELGGAVGRAIREFRVATSELRNEATGQSATQEGPAHSGSTVQPPAAASSVQPSEPAGTADPHP